MGVLNGAASKIAWGGPPPPDESTGLTVFTPAPGQTITGWFLDARFVEVWLHWTIGRTLPHLAPPAVCQLCERGDILLWKAHSGVFQAPPGRVLILAITYEAVRRCPELRTLSERGALRGQAFTYARASGRKTAKCNIRLESATAPASLPAATPTQDVLERCWASSPLTWAMLGIKPGDVHGEGKGASDEPA